MLTETGFTDVVVGDPVDTFGDAAGEKNARAYEVYGYAFRARKPLHVGSAEDIAHR